jgi:hypothetical protein
MRLLIDGSMTLDDASLFFEFSGSLNAGDKLKEVETRIPYAIGQIIYTNEKKKRKERGLLETSS